MIATQILKHLDYWTASDPRILWLELTSRCPFDCFFCMRKESRHPGEHMDFDLLKKILAQLRSPEIIRLNNAGESIHYPHLIEAIRLSKKTGARIELVTTLASASMELIPDLLHSGLDQLTVSLHTVDPVRYQRIYRYASFEALDQRLRQLLQLKAGHPAATPAINLSFVATKENLHDLPDVTQYAQNLGIMEIRVHRVISRNPENHNFDYELSTNHVTEAFRRDLTATVESTRRKFPDCALIYTNNALDANMEPGEQPAFYSEALPEGCCIADCIENPWETLNIFSNGDVMACGCRSSLQVLGNLKDQSLAQIWWSPSFRQFRSDYFLGNDPICRQCPWKKLFTPTKFQAKLPCSGGWSWQLLRGWYREENSAHIWSKPEAIAIIDGCGSSQHPRISLTGFLPNPAPATPNRLDILCNGIPLGEVVNHDPQMLEFAVDVPAPKRSEPPYCLQFKTEKSYCPNMHGNSPDIRSLGFALCSLAVKGAKIGWSLWPRG
jgi:radical SAM protein with 4Fe4S-binding SPASM domain